jgi:hypothetical protein
MPLRPVEFHILVALAAEERHGYAIIQEAASCVSNRGRCIARCIAC